MPEQDALARSANFREVNLGYTQQIAVLEAERCLQCKNPVCIAGCPVRVNIPRFIELLRVGDMAGAAASLLDDNALPCVTGRVCPQEIQCEGVCVRAKKGVAGRDRRPRALRRRLGDGPPGGARRRPTPAPSGTQGRHRRAPDRRA